MPRTRRQLLPVLLSAALLTACGSTVQVRGSAVVGGGSQLGGANGGQGLGGSSLGPGTTGTTGTGGLAGGTPVGGSTGAGSGGTTGFGPTGSTSVLPGSSDSSGPGVTAKEVYVGIINDVSAGAVNKAAGVGSITSGDNQANTRAIIDDINKHGGVAGRKLVPVYADFDSTSTQTLSSQYEAVCQTFTHDNPKVFAALEVGDDTYRQCLAKAGVSILGASLPTMGRDDFARFPNMVELDYPNVDRIAAYQLTPLVDQKYFTPWNTVNGTPAPTGTVKVGVLTYSDRVFSKAVDEILVPNLKKLGYDPVVEKIAPITRAADISSQAAAVKSAQLAFASNGVTHVIPFETNGGLSTLFVPTARSQQYYPRYGVSSASAAEALLESGAVDAQQYNGAVGFGWLPSLDLPADRNPANGPYSNDERRHCLQVMKDHGIAFDSGNAEGIALNSCASLYLLKAAADTTPSLLTWRTFMHAVESLGTAYQPASSLGGAFAPGRPDIVSRAYYWLYVSDCTCMQYTGPRRTIP
jgi:ABC-type branched-subunit amino acid transport system substrate-binding protein